MRRTLYEDDHEAFRSTARTFMAKEVVPFHEEWESEGLVDRRIWTAAGAQGLLGTDVPEEYGGGGIKDFRYNAVLTEETIAVGASGVGFSLHNDVTAPYLTELTTDEQKQRWLPGFCSGEIITAIAMTEPGAGSDLQGITTHAKRDGSDFVLNGSKTFITNGIHADLVLVVARTDPDAKAAQGTSLIAVERGMPGFERGRNLDKIGMKAQDTAELFFDDVRIPASNVVGELNQGFIHLMTMLPQERLSIAVAAVAGARAVFDRTLEYAKERKAFGRPVGSFQHNRFVLAEIATELEFAETYVEKAILEHNAGRYTVVDAAMAKWWTTELQKRVVDRCLQLHGGYGYMREYPIARAYTDTRITTIYGGTTEIMKEIVGRSLGV
ncbi:acyl-CoA dehydrogenase family protein [Cryptosporangium aurantiacum]|uniref:Acyl-[acyl-carrier-protein] dehydrogenase MbtN n=1 Tax=Cryptosporangium aurantiacum TaxID=134849 RepID=A0A1M7MQ00_9ACTN|nr:acyl-CoA dehydrogenase family protein [Cryptosporangium aurantiacum]SHM93020.1 Acyl-CoA dehydrogenase [Cryptosporangium aurantiacum]